MTVTRRSFLGLKLTPFRGHLILKEKGVRNAEVTTSIPG
jgi:hypothetical protein